MQSTRHLIVGNIQTNSTKLPYIKFRDDGHQFFDVDGFLPKIVEWLAEKYNFTYEYVRPKDGNYGAELNGTWDGLVGMVSRGETDISAMDMSVTYTRSRVVDFTYAFANNQLVLMLPYPRLASTISGIVKPFNYKVWIGIILSLFVAAFVLWFVEIVECRIKLNHIAKKQQWINHLWFFFRSLTNAEKPLNSTPSTRIVVISWFLVALVLIQSYSSCLTSYLTTPKFIPVANSLEEVANNNQLMLVVAKYSVMEALFLEATSEPRAKLGNQLRNHPENRLFVYSDIIIDMAANQNRVAVLQKSRFRTLMHNDFQRTKQCRLAGLEQESLFNNRLAFILKKSSPFGEIYNKDLMLLHQIALFDFWTRAYSPNPNNRCLAQLRTLRPPSDQIVLTLNYLSSSFIIYGVGVTTAIFAFVLELACNRF